MPGKADLWQNSLAPVTWITGFSPVNCDGYHGRVCDSALLEDITRPTMGGMPTASQLLAGRSKSTLVSAGQASVSQAGALGASRGFPIRPLQVTWEMTRASGWKAATARSTKSESREVNHFSTAEAFHLIEDVAAMHVPLLALTGGDPLTRPDLFPIIEFAAGPLGAHLSYPAAHSQSRSRHHRRTESMWTDAGWILIARLHTLAHRQLLGISGLFRRALDAIGTCHEVQLPAQVNTIVSRRNVRDLDSMIELLTRLDVVLWNVVFFVPTSRDEGGMMLSAEEHEDVFAKLYQAWRHVHFQIKTTEGQHYQRFLLQQRARESRGRLTEAEAITCAPKGVNDGTGLVFSTIRARLLPAGFFPSPAAM